VKCAAFAGRTADVECDINVDGSFDRTDEPLGRLDVVVASMHSDRRARDRR
jgi:hypothetical protein